MMVRDTVLYDRLQIQPDATDTQIKKAFLNLSKQYHPDKHEEEHKEEMSKKFQEISQAKDVLMDQQKRSAYDQIGMDFFKQGMDSAPQDPFGGGGFPFGGFPGMPPGFPGMPQGFPGMNFGGMNQSQEKIEPVVHHATVTLDQIYMEQVITITYPCNYSCLDCQGEGTSNGRPNVCVSCNGQGKRVQMIRMGPMIQQTVQDCGPCKGKGSIVDSSTCCKTCSGEGKISKQRSRNFQLRASLDNGQKIQLEKKGHLSNNFFCGT